MLCFLECSSFTCIVSFQAHTFKSTVAVKKQAQRKEKSVNYTTAGDLTVSVQQSGLTWSSTGHNPQQQSEVGLHPGSTPNLQFECWCVLLLICGVGEKNEKTTSEVVLSLIPLINFSFLPGQSSFGSKDESMMNNDLSHCNVCLLMCTIKSRNRLMYEILWGSISWLQLGN